MLHMPHAGSFSCPFCVVCRLLDGMTSNIDTQPEAVTSVVMKLAQELETMPETCAALFGTWDETHLWRGAAVAVRRPATCAWLASSGVRLRLHCRCILGRRCC